VGDDGIGLMSAAKEPAKAVFEPREVPAATKRLEVVARVKIVGGRDPGRSFGPPEI